jgi:hypothetical protein
MTKLIRCAVLAAIVLPGVSPVMADTVGQPRGGAQAAHNPTLTDMSKPNGGYDPNSPEGNRAFWDYKARQGGR